MNVRDTVRLPFDTIRFLIREPRKRFFAVEFAVGRGTGNLRDALDRSGLPYSEIDIDR